MELYIHLLHRLCRQVVVREVLIMILHQLLRIQPEFCFAGSILIYMKMNLAKPGCSGRTIKPGRIGIRILILLILSPHTFIYKIKFIVPSTDITVQL